jgi:hypothetical protein
MICHQRQHIITEEHYLINKIKIMMISLKTCFGKKVIYNNDIFY